MDLSFPPLPQFDAPHFFRLGLPSYVYPADILPNVAALAPYVDDIELVLFESRAKHVERKRPGNVIANIPSAETIAHLAELAQKHNLTYTVHFPIDRHLGSVDAGERIALQEQMLAIMQRARPLRPFAYILHLEGVTRNSTPARIRAWASDIAGLLPALIAQAGDPALLCVENLNYPFAWCEGLLDRFGLGVCIDLGHLWVGGYNVKTHLKRHLPRTRVIHLHGVHGEHDHLALTALSSGRLRSALNSIDKFTGVLTLEMFNYAQVRDSVICLNQCNCKAGRSQ